VWLQVLIVIGSVQIFCSLTIDDKHYKNAVMGVLLREYFGINLLCVWLEYQIDCLCYLAAVALEGVSKSSHL
jgi:hypothetical protein